MRPRLTPVRRPRPRRLVAAGLITAVAAALGAAPAANAAAKYVAMGDSYSSGDGVTPYLDWTDTPVNGCRRSAKSYAGLLSIAKGYTTDGEPKAGSFDFVACSGGVTHDLFLPNWKNPEDPQLEALGPETELVTLTIGGNDLGFTNWAEACFNYAPKWFGFPGPPTNLPGVWGCTASNSLLIKQTKLALDALAGVDNGAILRTGDPSSADPTLGEPKLDRDGSTMKIRSVAEVLSAIHDHAPQAKIFLAGYPHLFGTNKSKWTANGWNHVSGFTCDVTPPTALTYDYLDATTGAAPDYLGANAVADRYAGIQRAAVDQLAATGVPVTFVDPQPKFETHGNCDTATKWINGISPTLSGSMHPNATGHKDGYKQAFLQAPGF